MTSELLSAPRVDGHIVVITTTYRRTMYINCNDAQLALIEAGVRLSDPGGDGYRVSREVECREATEDDDIG